MASELQDLVQQQQGQLGELQQRMECMDLRTTDMARNMRREQLSTAVKAATLAAGGPLRGAAARLGEHDQYSYRPSSPARGYDSHSLYAADDFSSPGRPRGVSELDQLRDEVCCCGSSAAGLHMLLAPFLQDAGRLRRSLVMACCDG